MKTFNEYSTPELVSLITKMHTNEHVSLRTIASELKTYPVKIFRFCKKHKIPTLSKGESLKAGYAAKRIVSNRKGVVLTELERAKIGEAQHTYWEGLSKDKKEERRAQQSKSFNKRSAAEKYEFAQKGCRAIRKAADEGSKLEKAIMVFFEKHNIIYHHHYTELFSGTKLEADFYLPEHNVVLEIDGPSHFAANFGIDNYEQQIKADNKKNGVVLNLGMSILRLQHRTTLYPRNYRKVCKLLENVLSELSNEVRIIDVVSM